MPPYDGYSSVLDGSLRIESSTNSDRYGNGSLIVQNGCEFYGSSDQYLKTTSTLANLYVQSAKNFSASAPQGTVVVTGLTGASLTATAGNVTASGTSANLTATTGGVSVSGGTSASLTSTAGGVSVGGATSASVSSTLGPASLTATAGDATVQASGTVYLTGAIKTENFASATCSSTNDYLVKSVSANATLQGVTGEARVYGHTLAHLRGTNGVKVETTSGDATVTASGTVYLVGNYKDETFVTVNAKSSADYSITSSAGNAKLQSTANDVLVYGKTLAHVRADSTKIESAATDVKLVGFTSVDTTAPTISSAATTSVSLSAPTINVVATTLSKVDAPTVEVGKTSNTVTISQTGKATNVQGDLAVLGSTTTKNVSVDGNCTITGNLTVSGALTTISTENLLVKDNIIVLNSASAAGKDAGLLFTRSTGNDSASLYWEELTDKFVLATTKSTQDSATLVKETYSDLQCRDITANSINLTNFGTKTFTLGGQSPTPVSVDGINKTRGSYEFQIQSAADNGSVYNYKVVKANKDANSSSFGVHAGGDDGSQVWVKWDADAVPKFYMKNYSTSPDPLVFYINYITV